MGSCLCKEKLRRKAKSSRSAGNNCDETYTRTTRVGSSRDNQNDPGNKRTGVGRRTSDTENGENILIQGGGGGAAEDIITISNDHPITRLSSQSM